MLSRPLRTACRSVTHVLTANSSQIQTPWASGSFHLCPPNMYLLSRLEPEVLCPGQMRTHPLQSAPSPVPLPHLAQQALPWMSIPHSSTPAWAPCPFPWASGLNWRQVCPPGNAWQCLGMFLAVTPEGSCYCMEQIEASDAAKCPNGARNSQHHQASSAPKCQQGRR